MTLLPLMDLRKSAGVLDPVPAAAGAAAGAEAGAAESLMWLCCVKKNEIEQEKKTKLSWRKKQKSVGVTTLDLGKTKKQKP